MRSTRNGRAGVSEIKTQGKICGNKFVSQPWRLYLLEKKFPIFRSLSRPREINKIPRFIDVAHRHCTPIGFEGNKFPFDYSIRLLDLGIPPLFFRFDFGASRQTRHRWRAQEGWKHPTRRDSVSVLIYKNSPRTPNLPS